MPRRNDIQKILLIGSGPIVIGQAAEFDYSGVQACKVLLEEGYEVVLVNSNPATIMTDPEFADRTYIEPLLPGPVAKVIERERPDALLPTLGGQTALNLAKALHDDGTLERFGVELIGADYEAIHRAEDREAFRTHDGGGRAAGAVLEDRRVDPAGRAGPRVRRAHPSDHRPAGVHARRTRRWRGQRRDGVRPGRLRGARRQPDQPGAGRGVGARLGRVRARGDARPQRQRGDHLLDRERGPDGRPHRRLGDDRPRPDAARRPLPGPPRPGYPRDPRRRGGDRRLERAIRGQPGERRDRGDRDEPARFALLRARLEGDRVPDREDRREARRRLRAGGDPQRHHPGDAGVLRADDRLRRHQGAPLRVREVPRRRGPALDPHEVGRRVHGDRAHLPRVLRQGDAIAGARRRAGDPGVDGRSARSPGNPFVRPLRPDPRRIQARGGAGANPGGDHDRSLVPARAPRAGDGG